MSTEPVVEVKGFIDVVADHQTEPVIATVADTGFEPEEIIAAGEAMRYEVSR